MAQFQEITALHFETGEPIRIRWQGGLFSTIMPARSAPDQWIAPALFDVQINGYAGVDFQQDQSSVEDLRRAIRQLRNDGCPFFFVTLVTDEWNQLLARLARLRQWKEDCRELLESIAGWHIEGPFLSEKPGFHGAHPPHCMRDPHPADMEQLRKIAGSDPLLVTLAPERAGAAECIARAAALDIRVSLGHTDASAAQLRRAQQAGAIAFTHLGNACPKELDRHDNILWRVLDDSGLSISLIPDAIHVSPPLFRIVHHLLSSERIFYTTDAMAAAAAPAGEYTIGSLRVCVGEDQIVRQPGRTNFAGSALRPIEGIWRAARMLRKSWREVWPAFSIIPARCMGIQHALASGAPANFCLLRFSPDGSRCDLETFLGGKPAGKSEQNLDGNAKRSAAL